MSTENNFTSTDTEEMSITPEEETSITADLFSFITLRAPEPTAKSKQYVQHPNIGASDVYQSISEGGNLTDFPAMTGEEQVRNINPELNDFVNWLGEGGEEITPAELADRAQDMELVDEEALLTLWDNLFYQAFASQSPGLQRLLMRSLIASQIIQSIHDGQIPDTDGLADFLDAIVLLPTQLFQRDVPFAEDGSGAASVPNIQGLNKAHDTLLAHESVKQYERAITETLQAQEAYNREETGRYEVARSGYKEAAAQFEEEELQRAIDKAAQKRELGYEPITPTYEPPAFNYEPAPEYSASVLQATLSARTFDLVDATATELSRLGVVTWSRLIPALEEKARNAAAEAFDTVLAPEKQIVFGGSVFTVGKPSSLSADGSAAFVASAVDAGDGNYKIALTADFGGPAQIASASYRVVETGQLGQKVEWNPTRDTTNIVLFPDTVKPGNSGIMTVAGEFTLLDSSRYTFNIPVETNGTVKGGVITKEPLPPTSPAWPVTPKGQPPVMKPSTFGVRRLGIADYRKVQQSICCYVPGEVSHIENIMAREYKERSTRRLHRTEDITTVEITQENEKQTDTITTERFELQQEIEKVREQQSQWGITASASYSYHDSVQTVGANLSGSYSSTLSKSESERQSISYAKEVTQRAMERVLRRVREERINKIIDEYEEQYKHGFDNRGDAAKNISGVYRWVDKVYRNQMLNYGKRLTYEFMIPEPAQLHKEALKQVPAEALVVSKPVDFRTSFPFISSPQQLNRYNYGALAASLQADVEAPPTQNMWVGTSFDHFADANQEVQSKKEIYKLPEGYYTVSSKVTLAGKQDFDFSSNKVVTVTVGNQAYAEVNNGFLMWLMVAGPSPAPFLNTSLEQFYNEIPLSFTTANYHTISANISLQLACSPAWFEKWQVETYKALLDAYQEKLDAYNEAVEAAKNRTSEPMRTNPLFYRLIENTVLKKNCMGYLVGESYLGQNFITGTTIIGTKPIVSLSLDHYSAVARFLELAFEWDIMSYNYYPFYWGERSRWSEKYLYQNDDALFHSFMQAGMARVVVTVRPGFEQAVMYYMGTGLVWNGGDPPLLNDQTFKDIVDDLKYPEYVIEGTWETRVPSTLTVIQSDTVALLASGLPCDDKCSEPKRFISSEAKLERLRDEEETATITP